jgi:hypothetical protein
MRKPSLWTSAIQPLSGAKQTSGRQAKSDAIDPKPTFRNARILAANFRPPRTNFNPKLEHDYRLFTTLPPKMRST